MTSPRLHEELQFLAPSSSARADELSAWLARGLQHGGTVADAGCGWAELHLLELVGGCGFEVVQVAEASTCGLSDARCRQQRPPR